VIDVVELRERVYERPNADVVAYLDPEHACDAGQLLGEVIARRRMAARLDSRAGGMEPDTARCATVVRQQPVDDASVNGLRGHREAAPARGEIGYVHWHFAERERQEQPPRDAP
jgi:hypothetical protein